MVTKSKKKPKKAKTDTPSYAQVTIQEFALDELEDAPYNSRTITAEALSGLANSLEEFGLLSYPVVNMRKEGPRIVGGHQRVRILREQGVEKVKCIVVELDEILERRANFTLNNRAIQGQFIPELTKEILDKIREREGDGKASLFARLNFDKLVKKIARTVPCGNGKPSATTGKSGETDDDAEPTLKRTDAISKHGAFYKLGDHVLYCGALKSAGSLLGFPVEHADMAFARLAEDKPINVGFLDAHLGHIIENTSGAIYIVTNTNSMAQVQDRFIALNGHWSSTIIWQHPDPKGHPDEPYYDCIVPVIYGWPEGSPHHFFGEKRSTNLFTLKKTPKSEVPVEIAAQAMLLSSDPNAAVLDPDVGRGASVIAAEKTGRRLMGYVRTAYACDIVRKRWAEYVHGRGTKWLVKTPEEKHA